MESFHNKTHLKTSLHQLQDNHSYSIPCWIQQFISHTSKGQMSKWQEFRAHLAHNSCRSKHRPKTETQLTILFQVSRSTNLTVYRCTIAPLNQIVRVKQCFYIVKEKTSCSKSWFPITYSTFSEIECSFTLRPGHRTAPYPPRSWEGRELC